MPVAVAAPPFPLAAWIAFTRSCLVNTGSGSFSLDSSVFKRGKYLFALEPLRFGDLVNPFFRH